MKFGKLSNLSQLSSIDFSLPQDHRRNSSLLQSLSTSSNHNERSQSPRVYVGCTGWSMKEWVGTVYPKGTKSKDYLKHYVRQFNTIELNTTHYRIPKPETIQQWRQTATKDFKFAPKIPQSISHSRDLGRSTDYLTRFCGAINGLQENLGCSFMQLPPYFDVTRLPVLASFLKRWSNHLPLAIEIRHESWFENPEHLNALCALLQEHNTALVITDVAGRRDVLHARLTTNIAMIRFVGNGLHTTDYDRANAWCNRLQTWLQQGLQEVYFFPHQPDNLLAPEMVQYIVEQMQRLMGDHLKIKSPKLNNDTEGEQMSLW